MASTVWKGYISFGLISVPIRLFVAARENHVSFNQIHQVCGSRIKQQTFCPTCDRVVERSELVKGYAVDKENYVIVSNEELKGLEAQSSETMEIVQFVNLPEVDPLYYQTSYFSVAEDPGRKAYSLIHKGMEQLKLGAIAKITLHQREQIVMIRPFEKGLVLHTLYYPEEIRAVAEYDNQPDVAVQKAEVELAEQFMKQLTGDFHPENFKDEYENRVEQLIESKQGQAEAPAAQPKRKLAPVIDLMEALRRSMGQAAPASVTASAPPPNPDDDEKKPPQRSTKSPARRKKAAAG
ncbi:MAG TPA: Ku protein [Acidobacteriaceae bacterium]|jgi:DNA end-binding protein Ku|nr:Ku protein [Acidobacteriaceae bacterium]